MPIPLIFLPRFRVGRTNTCGSSKPTPRLPIEKQNRHSRDPATLYFMKSRVGSTPHSIRMVYKLIVFPNERETTPPKWRSSPWISVGRRVGVPGRQVERGARAAAGGADGRSAGEDRSIAGDGFRTGASGAARAGAAGRDLARQPATASGGRAHSNKHCEPGSPAD